MYSLCITGPGELLEREELKKLAAEKAVELIKEENYLFNEVSYQVGFSSQSYFTKCFKKVYNMTPKEYFSNKK